MAIPAGQMSPETYVASANAGVLTPEQQAMYEARWPEYKAAKQAALGPALPTDISQQHFPRESPPIPADVNQPLGSPLSQGLGTMWNTAAYGQKPITAPGGEQIVPSAKPGSALQAGAQAGGAALQPPTTTEEFYQSRYGMQPPGTQEEPAPIRPKDVQTYQAPPEKPAEGAPGPVAGAGAGGPAAPSFTQRFIDENKKFTDAQQHSALLQQLHTSAVESGQLQYADQIKQELDKTNTELTASDASIKEMQAAHLADADKRLGELDEHRKALLDYHEDPNRIYNNLGVAGHVLNILGSMVGAIGQDVRKSNAYLDQMNKLQEQDIAAQRADYKAQQGKYDAEVNTYARYRQLGLDDEAAAKESKLALIDASQRQLTTMAAGYESEAIHNKASEIYQTLEDQKATIRHAQKMDELTRLQNATAGRGGGGGGLTPMKRAELIQKVMMDPKIQPPKNTVKDTNWAAKFVMSTYGKGENVAVGAAPSAGNARMGMAEVRAANAEDALTSLGKSYGLEIDPKTGIATIPSGGYAGAKGRQVGNVAGNIVGTTDAAYRQASKSGAVAEAAASLAGGAPTDTMLKEIGKAFDTQDPAKIAAAINHYRPLISNARARYAQRASMSEEVGGEAAESEK